MPLTIRRTALLLAALLTLSLTPLPAHGATGKPSSGTTPVTAEDRTTLELVAEGYATKAHNDQRTAGVTRNGVTHRDVARAPAMTAWTDILTVSRHWADSIDLDRFRHNPDYASQYGHWRRVGENIAAASIQPASSGTPSRTAVRQTTERLMQLWWESTGHRTNWMRPEYDQFAVGASVRVTTWQSPSGPRDYWILTLVSNFRDHDGTAIRGSSYATDGSAPPNETDRPTSASVPPDAPSAAAIPLAGDWDGDGVEDPGWYDRARVVLRMGNGEVRDFTYGRAGDVPIVGDWDGDGIDTVSVIRDRTWHLNNRHGGGDAYRSFVYGRLTGGDLPLVGDWDGDGRDGIGIVRDGEWHLRNDQSGGPGRIVFVYGRVLRGDVPLVGDWDGDGRDTIGIHRGGEWHLRDALKGGTADRVVTFGRASDLPVVADFDGDGASGTTAVRGANWYVRHDLRGGSAQLEFRLGV